MISRTRTEFALAPVHLLRMALVTLFTRRSGAIRLRTNQMRLSAAEALTGGSTSITPETGRVMGASAAGSGESGGFPDVV